MRHLSSFFSVTRLTAVGLALLLAVSGTLAWGEGSTTAGVTLLKNRQYQEALTTGIRSARKSVVCCFYLFKATDANSNIPQRIVEELVKASRRGVDVTVILERNRKHDDSLNRDNLHTAALLSRGGVKVFFDSPKITTHAKVAVIDRRYVYLGSHNLTQSALTRNNELSVLIDSPAMAGEITSYLQKL
ncbi:MAG: phospholipase [Geobacter sp.]|nr:phospholipase [Geobacter sp.]